MKGQPTFHWDRGRLARHERRQAQLIYSNKPSLRLARALRRFGGRGARGPSEEQPVESQP